MIVLTCLLSNNATYISRGAIHFVKHSLKRPKLGGTQLNGYLTFGHKLTCTNERKKNVYRTEV